MMTKRAWKTLLPLLSLTLIGAAASVAADAPKDAPSQKSEITLLRNSKRVLTPGQAHRITYSLLFRQPWTKETLPEITVSLRPVGTMIDSSETYLFRPFTRSGVDKRHFSLTFTVPKLAPGDYRVDFGYRREGKFLQAEQPAYIFTSVQNRQPEFLLDNGTLLWHGKPFFPIGMYHPGDDYQLLADNGFNTVQGNSSTDIETFKKSLDKAEKYGLAVDVPFYSKGQVKKNLANSLKKIEMFADHPAVLCWKIIDEPDIASNQDVAFEVPAAYRAFKKADPNHPIELTLAHDTSLEFWSNFSDIVQIDRYPVRSASEASNLTAVSSFARNAKSVMEPWQNLSVVVQSGWTLDLSTQPTVAQARSMVYLALISGAKGIFWYSMHEGTGWDLTKTPLWPHLKDINAEITQLSKPLMLGEYVPVQVTNLQTYATARKLDDQLYVLVTNPLNQEVEVRLNLYNMPKLPNGRLMKSTFSKGKDTVKVSHSVSSPNSVTLKLKALQSETIVFDVPKTK